MTYYQKLYGKLSKLCWEFYLLFCNFPGILLLLLLLLWCCCIIIIMLLLLYNHFNLLNITFQHLTNQVYFKMAKTLTRTMHYGSSAPWSIYSSQRDLIVIITFQLQYKNENTYLQLSKFFPYQILIKTGYSFLQIWCCLKYIIP